MASGLSLKVHRSIRSRTRGSLSFIIITARKSTTSTHSTTTTMKLLQIPSPWPLRALRSIRPYSTRLRTRLDIPPPFPVTKTCPEPTCACPPTPSMPEGHPIDYDQPLNGTMAAYAQQLLVCTGQRDWTSRIEDDGKDQSWGELARGLKRLLGRGGPFASVC